MLGEFPSCTVIPDYPPMRGKALENAPGSWNAIAHISLRPST
jgi:hypothetical protein